jgi:hypothetical protein
MNNNGLPPGGTVHLEFAKIPKTPEHRFGNQCEGCRFWQSEQSARVAQVAGGGQVAISQLIAAGMKIPPSDFIATIAPCAFNPIWSMVTDEHWCGQWKRKHTASSVLAVESDASD